MIGDTESQIYPLLKLFVDGFLPVIQLICALGFIPSVIFAIVMSAKHPTDDYEEKINNIIESNQSLDEKMLITFIGINYDKITTKKFSISAMFLSWMYMLYRKMYIPSIIGMIVIRILALILEPIYTIIILSFCVVLGLNFNKWYVAYSKKQVDKIKTNNPNANEMELINICKKKGGTNIGVAILIYIIFMISGFIFPQTKEDVDAGIWGLNFSMPSNFIKQDEKVAYFTYEVEYDASTYQYCTFKLSAQNNASAIEATSGLHSPDNYIYKDYSPVEAKNINSNTWYYQTKKSNTYESYFYSTKYNDIHYLIEFKIGNDNTQCHEDYTKIISSLKFK